MSSARTKVAFSDRREFIARMASAAFGMRPGSPWPAARPAQTPSSRREVPWLQEGLQAPEAPPAPARLLPPVLADNHGRTINTLAGWRRRRNELEQGWRAVIGHLSL